ncbi:protein kinase containing Z-DNA binding domains isoform X2 [Scleropages formosus]|uniref:protein kinase containing Z-DNA binding domains isoform X2 n=1 Tax=Scleropages formosus TaxID=113540 RepID=UPI00087894DC|nr:eukaryotic translation initiation factor 2-alpha kinase 3-like isoform X2 [Scleropages formosus]
MEDKIIEVLRRAGTPVMTLDIAKAVGLNTKKDVNSTLYGLRDRGVVRRTDSNPPKWSLVSPKEQEAPGRSGKMWKRTDEGAEEDARDCRKPSNTADTANSSRGGLRGLEEFDIEEDFDEGGYGWIFKARHKVDRKCYAVKIVKYDGEKEKREVEALAALQHSSIVRYYTSWIGPPYKCNNTNTPSKGSLLQNCSTESSGGVVFEQGGCSFPSAASCTAESREEEELESWSQTSSSDMSTKQMIATAKRCLYIQMEFCEGGSLDQWLLDKGKERSKGEATEIFQQIVKGVEYIHSSGHIHRDLKPQNILFAADGRIKIGDFGLVTTIGDKNISPVERTKEKGTKSYMSPEQENQSTYDEKTDIFPLGLIFFELLWTMGTMAEKNKIWKELRSRSFPVEFREKYAFEHKLIYDMLSLEPEDRPGASDIKERLHALMDHVSSPKQRTV